MLFRSGSDGTPDSSSVYAERYSARSPNDTLLADTQLLATPATSDELLSDAFQRYFPMSDVADLTKHLLSLGPDAIAEIAAIFQVTVAPSTTTQSPLPNLKNNRGVSITAKHKVN